MAAMTIRQLFFRVRWASITASEINKRSICCRIIACCAITRVAPEPRTPQKAIIRSNCSAGMCWQSQTRQGWRNSRFGLRCEMYAQQEYQRVLPNTLWQSSSQEIQLISRRRFSWSV